VKNFIAMTISRASLALLGFLFLSVLLVGIGCKKKSEAMKAIESDANGYICSNCKSKFCTDRKVIPSQCPDCKNQNIQRVLSYKCEVDKQMTIEARNVPNVKCKQCAAPVNQIYMPQKVDLIAWGATFKTEAQVASP
jgi:hypothetical protein